MKKVLLTVLSLLLLPSVAFATVQTFTTGGTGTFIVPAGVISMTVEVWAAGGQGGGSSGTNAGGGGGGGGGNYVASTTYNVTPLASINYYIGRSNATGTATTDGARGEDSMFSASTTLKATGGFGGGVGVSGAAGATTTGNVGSTQIPAGNGATGLTAVRSGGGGGGAGSVGAGGVATTNAGGAAGTPDGGAGGAGTAAVCGTGTAGSAPSGGGGGAYRTNNGCGSQIGAAGARGQIRVTYTSSITFAPWQFMDF